MKTILLTDQIFLRVLFVGISVDLLLSGYSKDPTWKIQVWDALLDLIDN